MIVYVNFSQNGHKDVFGDGSVILYSLLLIIVLKIQIKEQ